MDLSYKALLNFLQRSIKLAGLHSVICQTPITTLSLMRPGLEKDTNQHERLKIFFSISNWLSNTIQCKASSHICVYV